MPITKAKKVEIVKGLEEKIGGATAMAFVNFHGLSVALATELRRLLREQGVGLTVAKKTLIRRAFAETPVKGELPALEGEIALAYGTDPIAPARGVYEFEKKNKESVKLVGGVYEGAFVDASFMMTLATIPSREVLLGKFVNLLNSPIQRFVMAVDQIAKTKGEVTS